MNKMRIVTTGIATAMLFASVALPALAKPTNSHTEGQAGNSNRMHMNLEVNDGPEGSWGRVSYNKSGESMDYVLNAHGLEPDTNYHVKSLGITIGSGTTDENGNLHIMNSWTCTKDLDPARINVRSVTNNESTLWTGPTAEFIFECTLN